MTSKKKEYIRLIIVFAVLFTILGGFLLYLSVPLLSSKTAVLATEPVDPFDLIRGQYIIIRYEIGTIPTISGTEVGDNVYVSLIKDVNGTSRYKTASRTKPKKDEIFIRGTIESINADITRVEYGIEQYFFERGATFEIRGMEVEVKLSNNGGALITELLQDKKPVEMTYKNKSITS